jgi:Zn-dependent protease with chaperone function
MDFFGDQEQAKRRTGWLVFLFSAAVVGIVFSVYFSLALTFSLTEFVPENYWTPLGPFPFWNLPLFTWTAGGVALLIGAGSITKYIGLMSGGGERVAQMFPGGFLQGHSGSPKEKMLVNIVEEMAIASGETVPRIYLVDSDEINAFVAGVAPGDAVLGVTRGCLDQLNREELQGVVAHEFSHILNGDMGFSLRLIGVLYGILLVNIVGQIIFRSISQGRGRGDAKIVGIVFGLSLMLIGWIGVFFGRLIKSAVSRQREFLADAAAVQFTRNPRGIARALMKIRQQHPVEAIGKVEAEEVSHLLFSHGIGGYLLASHPPLLTRIRRLDPRGQISLEDVSEGEGGEFSRDKSGSGDSLHDISKGSETDFLSEGRVIDENPMSTFSGTVRDSSPFRGFSEGLAGVASHFGEVAGLHAANAVSTKVPVFDLKKNDIPLDGAREWMARVDPLVLNSARDPRVAGWLLLILAKVDLSSDRAGEDELFQGVSGMSELSKRVAGLQVEDVLPICDIAISTLKTLPPSDLKKLAVRIEQVEASVRAEGGGDPFLDYLLKSFLKSRIEDAVNPPKGRDPYGGDLGRHFNSVRVVISALALRGGGDRAVVKESYRIGITAVMDRVSVRGDHLLKARGEASDVVDQNYCDFFHLDKALFSLKNTSPLLKSGLLDGCLACISHDEMVTREEAVLYRAFAGVLNHPVPAIFPRS